MRAQRIALGFVLASAAVCSAQTSVPQRGAGVVERTHCTTLAPAEWIDLDDFKLIARHRGYRTAVLKTTAGSCYEIYGYDPNGNLVEAYFNPVNGRLVRSNTVLIAR